MAPTATTTSPPRQADRPAGWWCYPLTWALIAWAAPMLTDRLAPWWLAAVAAAAGLLGIGLVRTLWPQAVYGSLCGQAQLFAVAVAAALGGWLWRVRTVGDPLLVWQDWLIGAAVLAAWWVLLALRAPAAAAAMDARRQNLPDEVAAEAPPVGGIYHDILRRAGVVPACRILRVESSPSGGVQSVHLRPETLPDKQIMTFDSLRGKLSTIATHADLLLDDIDIDEDDVTPAKITSSHWVLHFTVKRVLRDTFPYPLRMVPRRADEPSRLGIYETDQPLDLQLFDAERGATCMDLVAGMGGGKTTVLHNAIAEDNACDAWEVWLFSSQKLTHVAWRWVKPWLEGKTDRPPVDAVFGQSQDRILTGLVWACQLAVAWNSANDAVREVAPGNGGLSLVIDESSDCLKHPKTVQFRLGAEMVTMNASQMVAKLAEIGRTSPVKVYRASQYGLFDSAGSAGSESRRNFLAAIIGRVTRASDANNVAPAMPPGWNPMRLRSNMLYVQPNLEEPTVLRAKAFALYKELVDPVAIAYSRWRNGLDPEATARLKGYEQRWAPEHHAELVSFAAAKGLTWPATSGQQALPAATLATDPTTTPTTVQTSREDTPVPTPADDNPLPDAPADAFPAGWADETFDVFAAITGEQPNPTGDDAVDDDITISKGSVLDNPDVSGIKEAAVRMGADITRIQKMAQLPVPLGRILADMMHPRAREIVSTGWVPTEVLAESLGRFDADADAETRRKAIAQLGWEINQITGLTSQEIPRPAGLGRRSGWKVDELRAAGDRLMAALPDA